MAKENPKENTGEYIIDELDLKLDDSKKLMGLQDALKSKTIKQILGAKNLAGGYFCSADTHGVIALAEQVFSEKAGIFVSDFGFKDNENVQVTRITAKDILESQQSGGDGKYTSADLGKWEITISGVPSGDNNENIVDIVISENDLYDPYIVDPETQTPHYFYTKDENGNIRPADKDDERAKPVDDKTPGAQKGPVYYITDPENGEKIYTITEDDETRPVGPSDSGAEIENEKNPDELLPSLTYLINYINARLTSVYRPAGNIALYDLLSKEIEFPNQEIGEVFNVNQLIVPPTDPVAISASGYSFQGKDNSSISVILSNENGQPISETNKPTQATVQLSNGDVPTWYTVDIIDATFATLENETKVYTDFIFGKTAKIIQDEVTLNERLRTDTIYEGDNIGLVEDIDKDGNKYPVWDNFHGYITTSNSNSLDGSIAIWEHYDDQDANWDSEIKNGFTFNTTDHIGSDEKPKA